MKNRLADHVYNKDNNFNLLRFIAATLVMLGHSYPLSQGQNVFDPLKSAVGVTFGTLAVDIFFITSGFLVCASLYSRSLVAYLWGRFIRIYPGLIVAVLFSVFVVGTVFSTVTLFEYFTDSITIKYLLRNSTLLWGVKYKLPGVFEQLPYEKAVNGSLWTLPSELKCYIYLALIGYVFVATERLFRYNVQKVGFLLIALALISFDISNTLREVPASPSYRLFGMFFVGATAFIWREKIVFSKTAFTAMLIILCTASMQKSIFYATYRLLLVYIVLYIAFVPVGAIRQFNKVGDYSYGIYIYAFPIQQSIIALFGKKIPAIELFAYSFCATICLAAISWHFVEKKFLGYKERYSALERRFPQTILYIQKYSSATLHKPIVDKSLSANKCDSAPRDN